ncbi:DUF4382 domain-containing protein [Proteobacteria bacterium 005FR1]|nr:DUF4382 domain-containing protein [Proteobacteria bacterium 005FR1]
MDKSSWWQLLYLGILATVSLIGVAGCDGTGVDERFGGDDGNLSLWITDAPVQDVDSVIVTITGVVIEPVEGDPIEITFDTPEEVDLIDVIDDPDRREELLDDYPLPVGSYTSLRLVLDETRLYVDTNGRQEVLTIPEEEKAGLELEFNVDVEDDTELDLTIDFDVRKSLRRIDATTFELHPSLRIVRTERTGTLVGVVDEDLIVNNPRCNDRFDFREGNAVYVFSGAGTNPQDIQGNAGDPLATGIVELDSGVWEFVVGFLPQGNYTAVFTCDAELDDPEIDDDLDMFFSTRIDVEIDPEQVTEIEFEQAAAL